MKKFSLLLAAFLALLGSININAADIPTGLVRIKSGRTSYYLSTATQGSATTTPIDLNKLDQVWILLADGSGYSLRSANTGEYLQTAMTSTASGKATLYIRKSPNATSSRALYNFSAQSDFSGDFLNTNTSYNLFKYSFDDGCDWYIEDVTNFTMDEIRERMLGMLPYASQLEDGAYYRILSYYDLVLTEGSDVTAKTLDAENFTQYWQLHKSGSGWYIQAVVSEKYLQRQTTTSAPYHVGTTQVPFNISPVADEWDYRWTISFGTDAAGLHDASSQGHNVVLWSTNAAASEWHFEKVELSDEDIANARGGQAEYDDLIKKKNTYQRRLNALFADRACTILNEDIQALSDEELAEDANFIDLNEDMKAMVLKVKNDTWQQYTDNSTGYTADYERFFRVADYQVYSHYQEMMNGSNFTMSNSFGKLSGPTGIVADRGEIIYVYVDAAPRTGCTLQLEAVSTEGVPGNHQTGETTDLVRGLNVFRFSEQKMLYIFHQLNDPKKYLANYPDIKIHIEGGKLNGYWDATRGMTNADWKLLQKDLLKASPVLNLKTKHLVFAMNANLVKQCEPKEMEGLMRIWDMIPENEERYMGVEDFEGRYRNVWNVFSIDYNYMFATTYGTYYHESTLSTIMNYENMRKAGALWGPSHEMGHNHQASINVIGTTESSNNMFSNINTFEQGIITTRRQIPVDVFWELSKETPWLQRNIWNTTSMFFQLYLYFHVQHHDDNFLPNLFRMMRKKPINKWSGPGNGGPTSYGKDDYLHLAKMICDVAQADLSEFFEAYGMFVPVDMMEVGDYSTYYVTTTKADINSAKRYMQKYPKKLGNIMFIDDHISPMKPADSENKFEGIPAANGLKTNNLDQHNEVGEYKNLPVGDVGDYESFDGHEDYDVEGDYFTLSGSTVAFKGTGYIGHKFYDLNGNLIWATNAKRVTLPESVKNLGVENFYVVAAQQNMTDVPCPYYKADKTPAYQTEVFFGKAEGSKTWWSNASTSLGNYLPENAIAVVGTEDAPENVIQTPNVINLDNTASAIVINGDKPFYLPMNVSADSLSFTKTVEGYAALNLPFTVTSDDIDGLKTATYADNVLTLVDALEVAAGESVVVSGDINLSQLNVTLVSGDYQPSDSAYVLAADGQAVISAEAVSPFIYHFNNFLAVRDLKSVSSSDVQDGAQVYDLAGRRVVKTNSPGLYIIRGHKVMMK